MEFLKSSHGFRIHWATQRCSVAPASRLKSPRCFNLYWHTLVLSSRRHCNDPPPRPCLPNSVTSVWQSSVFSVCQATEHQQEASRYETAPCGLQKITQKVTFLQYRFNYWVLFSHFITFVHYNGTLEGTSSRFVHWSALWKALYHSLSNGSIL